MAGVVKVVPHEELDHKGGASSMLANRGKMCFPCSMGVQYISNRDLQARLSSAVVVRVKRHSVPNRKQSETFSFSLSKLTRIPYGTMKRASTLYHSLILWGYGCRSQIVDGKDSEACGRAKRIRAEVGEPPLIIYSFDLYLTQEENKKNNPLHVSSEKSIRTPATVV